MRASIDLDRLGECTGSIVTFCRRTENTYRSDHGWLNLYWLDRAGFSVFSHVEFSTAGKRSHSPLRRSMYHAFVGKISCDLNLTARARLGRGALFLPSSYCAIDK